MKQWFKRYRLYVLLVVVLLAAGFTVFRGVSQRQKPTFTGTLTVWATSGLAGYPGGVSAPSGSWFEERARAYEAANPGVKVVVQTMDSPQQLEKSVVKAVENGETVPDLMFGRLLPELASQLANIEPLLGTGKKDYLPSALDGFRTNGQLQGIPALLEVQVLALNQQAFADAGVAVPANGKWSFAEFESALEQISGGGRYGLGFYILPGYYEWWPLAGGVVTADGKPASGVVDGLTQINRFREKGWLHPDTGKVPAEDIWQRFAQDSPAIAVMPVGTWAIPLLQQDPYNVDLAVAGFPGGHTVGHTYGFSVFQSKDKARVAAAADLAEFMTEPEQLRALARQTGLMPARKSAGNPFEGDPLLTRALDQAADQKALPVGLAWDEAEVPVTRELRLAVVGGKSPEAALEEVRKLLSADSAPAGQ